MATVPVLVLVLASSASSFVPASSAHLTPSSHHSVGRFRCACRCRSCRYSDFRRCRACRFRCRAFRPSSSQGCRCRRDRSSAPCLDPPSSDRREHWARGRRGPRLRPGHTGIGRTPRRRRTRRQAHANPRRIHPSRRHQPTSHRVR
jgi:hypothetical protein